MTSSPLHFCHANGFPAKSYNVMLNALSEHYQVSYLNIHGHHAQYPVTDNWPNLVDELIDDIQSRHQEPIIAVGHSMGGVLIYLAARKQPELFKHLILLDPPLLDNLTMKLIGLAKRFKFIDRITPAGRTNGRQEMFVDHAHALDYFSGKTLFKQADPRCLQDYIQHGTEAVEGGVKLKYTAIQEVAIYRTLPHRIALHNKPLPVPATLLYGQSSEVVRPAALKHMEKQVGMQTLKVNGGHMFPLEFPEQTAKHIRTVIEAI